MMLRMDIEVSKLRTPHMQTAYVDFTSLQSHTTICSPAIENARRLLVRDGLPNPLRRTTSSVLGVKQLDRSSRAC